MADELDDLACTAADALVSAKRRFAAVVGHERRLEATHAELAAKSGPAASKHNSRKPGTRGLACGT
jgi:hypothetical protein